MIFFAGTFNFIGAEAENQTLAHDAKHFSSKSWKQPELLSMNRTAIFRVTSHIRYIFHVIKLCVSYNRYIYMHCYFHTLLFSYIFLLSYLAIFTYVNNRNIQQPQNLVHFRLRPITFIYLHYLQFL